jgi:hypothetical protein
VISYALKRICRERGVEYTANHGNQMTQRPETLKLMMELWTQLQNFEATGRELNRLGFVRANGQPWTGSSVRATLRAHAQRQGLEPPSGGQERRDAGGAPRYLSDPVRRVIWQMHRNDGKSLRDICHWLKSQGVKDRPWQRELAAIGDPRHRPIGRWRPRRADLI